MYRVTMVVAERLSVNVYQTVTVAAIQLSCFIA